MAQILNAESSGEPAVRTGSVVALVGAVLALVIALGIPVSDELKIAILGVVVTAAPFVSGILTRSKVVPGDEVAARRIKTGEILAGPALSNVPDGTVLDEPLTPAA